MDSSQVMGSNNSYHTHNSQDMRSSQPMASIQATCSNQLRTNRLFTHNHVNPNMSVNPKQLCKLLNRLRPKALCHLRSLTNVCSISPSLHANESCTNYIQTVNIEEQNQSISKQV
jgi:hypothetical protein